MQTPPTDNTKPQNERNTFSREKLIFERLQALGVTDITERANFLVMADFLDYFIWRGQVVDLRGAR